MPFNDNLLFQLKTEGSPLGGGELVTSFLDTVAGFVGTPISGANQAAMRLNQLNNFGSFAFTNDAYNFDNAAFGNVTIIMVVKSTGTASGYVLGESDTSAIIKNFTTGKWEWFSTPRTVLADTTGAFQIVVCNVGSIGGVLRLGNQQATTSNFGEFEFVELDIFSRLTAPQITTKTDELNFKYFNIPIPSTSTETFVGVDSRMRGTDPAGQTPVQSTGHQLALLRNANSVSFDGSDIIPPDAGKTEKIINKSVNGRTLKNFVLNDMAAELASSATNKNFVNESGINDLGTGATAAEVIQSFADVQTFCDTNGIIHYPTTVAKIALGTLNTDAALVAAVNAKVDAVNASNRVTYATKIVEFDRNATLIDVTNTAVMPDGVHWAAAAKVVAARMINDRMNNTVAFPSFTTATIPNVVQNQVYSQQLAITNAPTAVAILSGAPTGMTVSNGGLLGGTITGAPGTYTPTFRATKANGDFTDKTYTMNVVAPGSDTTPPTVSIIAPSSGATVSGNVTITATAADNVGVTNVVFIVDDINTVGSDNSSPYNYLLDTSALTDGSHTVKAVATDAAGNSTVSASIPFTVDNIAPPLPPTTARLAWNASTDNVTTQPNIVYLLKYSLVSSAAATASNPIVLAAGVRQYDVPNVAQGTTVYMQHAARDEAGNVSAYSTIYSQTY
jgi:Bacterial Ig domain